MGELFSSNCRPYNGGNKLLIDESIPQLYYITDYSFIVIAHGLHVHMSLHCEMLSRLRANQPLFLILNIVRFSKKQHMPFLIVFGLTQTLIEPTISRTRKLQTAKAYLRSYISFSGFNFHIFVLPSAEFEPTSFRFA